MTMMMPHIIGPSRSHPVLDGALKYISVRILENDPSIHVVLLNRPRKRNALNAAMWREIGAVFGQLGTLGDGCRCVVLMGKGQDFCAGIDMRDPSFFPPQDSEDFARRAIAFRSQILEMQQCFSAMETSCPVPVIAAIHGNCIGAGIDVICCTDVRYCTKDAMFSVREARMGLAADVGTLQRFPKLVGSASRVHELCLTGEDFDASEAHRIGLVSGVLPSEADLWTTVLAVGRKMAANSPVAVTRTKLSLHYSRDHSVSEGLQHIATHNSIALLAPDLVQSFSAAAASPKDTNDRPSFEELLPHSRL